MATMKIRRPCCSSIRSCGVTAVYVLDVANNEIVERISAIRCYRYGYNHYVDIEYDPERHLIYYLYVSNRGNPWIEFYHIPPSMTEEEARQIVLYHHNLVDP